MKKITILTDDYINLCNILYSLDYEYNTEEVDVVSNCCSSSTYSNDDKQHFCDNCKEPCSVVETI